MIKPSPLAYFRLTAVSTLLICGVANAATVYVSGSAPVTTQILPEMAVIEATLGEIAQVSAESAEKVNAVISQSAQASREQAIFNNQTQRLETARRSFSVPESICSESASGIAAQARSASRATASSQATGSGVSKSSVKSRITGAPESVVQDAYNGAITHASYCTQQDYDTFGGTSLCPSVGSYPGGDSQARSLYDGAGTAGKAPDLTYTQDQIDAATAYMKNTARQSAGKTPGKGAAKTQAGQAYIGLQNEYNAIIDAAAEPQLALIAGSTPNSATLAAINEVITGSDSAKKYYDATVSETARSKGMSNREFEAFEVGRRYANTDYQTDLQAMDNDNLVREQIRISSLVAWQLNDIKEQLQKNNVLTGQLLAVTARDIYSAQLNSLSTQLPGGNNK